MAFVIYLLPYTLQRSLGCPASHLIPRVIIWVPTISQQGIVWVPTSSTLRPTWTSLTSQTRTYFSVWGKSSSEVHISSASFVSPVSGTRPKPSSHSTERVRSSSFTGPVPNMESSPISASKLCTMLSFSGLPGGAISPLLAQTVLSYCPLIMVSPPSNYQSIQGQVFCYVIFSHTENKTPEVLSLPSAEIATLEVPQPHCLTKTARTKSHSMKGQFFWMCPPCLQQKHTTGNSIISPPKCCPLVTRGLAALSRYNGPC